MIGKCFEHTGSGHLCLVTDVHPNGWCDGIVVHLRGHRPSDSTTLNRYQLYYVAYFFNWDFRAYTEIEPAKFLDAYRNSIGKQISTIQEFI